MNKILNYFFKKKVIKDEPKKIIEKKSDFTIEYYPLSKRYYPKFKHFYIKLETYSTLYKIESYIGLGCYRESVYEAKKIIEKFKEQRQKKGVEIIKLDEDKNEPIN